MLRWMPPPAKSQSARARSRAESHYQPPAPRTLALTAVAVVHPQSARRCPVTRSTPPRSGSRRFARGVRPIRASGQRIESVDAPYGLPQRRRDKAGFIQLQHLRDRTFPLQTPIDPGQYLSKGFHYANAVAGRREVQGPRCFRPTGTHFRFSQNVAQVTFIELHHNGHFLKIDPYFLEIIDEIVECLAIVGGL